MRRRKEHLSLIAEVQRKKLEAHFRQSQCQRMRLISAALLLLMEREGGAGAEIKEGESVIVFVVRKSIHLHEHPEKLESSCYGHKMEMRSHVRRRGPSVGRRSQKRVSPDTLAGEEDELSLGDYLETNSLEHGRMRAKRVVGRKTPN